MSGAMSQGMEKTLVRDGMWTLTVAADSHVGRRQNNEDALLCEPRLGLFAVADGMGGYEGGEVASRLTVTALRDFFARELDDGDCTWPFGLDLSRSLDENRLQVAIRLAHRTVQTERVGALGMMGSTVVALSLRDGCATIGHVGDSRLYRLRQGRLEQLTSDHSLYAELAAAGASDLPAKRDFHLANVITRALGMPDEVRADLRRETLCDGDTFLLCSDGVNEKLDDDALAALLGGADVGAICAGTISAAYDHGGRDNITAVVVRASLPR